MLLLDVCAVVCREDASEKWQEVEVREEADGLHVVSVLVRRRCDLQIASVC